jgi:hypothetical protein
MVTTIPAEAAATKRAAFIKTANWIVPAAIRALKRIAKLAIQATDADKKAILDAIHAAVKDLEDTFNGLFELK